MSANKSLSTTYKFTLSTDYKRADNTISNDTVKGGIDYTTIADTLANGVNADSVANLLFFKKYTKTSGQVETFDFDGDVLTDIWGETLDFSKVKAVIVHNTEAETETGKTVTLAWGGEAAVIKGGGAYIRLEPANAGIEAVTTNMTLTAGSETVNFNVILIGNDDTASS